MGQILHANARTTEAIRREISNSKESLAKAAASFNVNPKTNLPLDDVSYIPYKKLYLIWVDQAYIDASKIMVVLQEVCYKFFLSNCYKMQASAIFYHYILAQKL